MPNVLIGPGPLRNKPGRFREILEAAGLTPVDVPGEQHGLGLTPAELRAELPKVDALMAGGEPLPGDLLANCPRLRAIVRTGVGYDAVDMTAANAGRIVVGITPGTNQDSVAEQAFALLLSLTRRVVINERLLRSGVWDRTLVAPLRGKTLGLVGLGRIGRAMVPRALAFGMSVIAFDPAEDADYDARFGIRRLTFDEVLAASDVLSLHLPLSPTTRGLFDRKVFARMRPGSYLINTARGGLIVESDLREAIVSGHLAGAGLDVLAQEPPEPGNVLIGLDHVVISPHVAGVDTQSMADMANLAAQIIVDLYQGRWPAECIVNPGVGPYWKW